MESTMELGNPGVWAQFGLPGLVIFALFALIWFLISENRRNQGEFIVCMRDMGKMADMRQEETNKSITALSVVIEKSILINQNRSNG